MRASGESGVRKHTVDTSGFSCSCLRPRKRKYWAVVKSGAWYNLVILRKGFQLLEQVIHLRQYAYRLPGRGQDGLGQNPGEGFPDGIAEYQHGGLGRNGNGFHKISFFQGADLCQRGTGGLGVVEHFRHQAHLGR